MSYKRDHSYQYEDKSNPFYNGDVVSIREAFKQNLAQPYSNLNKSVQKYQNQGLSIEELIHENEQLQARIKSQEKEIQKLVSEKEMLLKSALSANQKLKGQKNKQPDLEENKSIQHIQQVKELEQQIEQMQLNESKLILQISQISTQLQQSQVKKKQRQAREELDIEDFIEKIQQKDIAIQQLLEIIRQNCQSIYTNQFHKQYLTIIDSDLYSQNENVLINNSSLQIKQLDQNFINIYKNGNEILGFKIGPQVNQEMVISQKINGIIKNVSFNHKDLKQQDGTKSELIFPNQVEKGQEEKLMNVGDEINNSSTTKLNEIWFYEIQNKNGKMLGAEIKQTKTHVVKSIIQKQVSMQDNINKEKLKSFKLHDVIIHTDQQLIIGVMGVYVDSKKAFSEGLLMQMQDMRNEENKKQSEVIVFNKQKQYQIQRQLQYLEIDINELGGQVDRMILCYKTENSHNNRVTNLQLEVGKKQENAKYLTKRVDVQQNKQLECKFLNDEKVLSDITLI